MLPPLGWHLYRDWSLHPLCSTRFSCALLLSVFSLSRYLCTRAHTYIYGSKSTHPPSQPMLQRVLESRACMLMITRRGLYLFHLICAPSGHGSCSGRGRCAKGGLRREEESPASLSEIYSLFLSTAKRCRLRVCVSARAKKENRENGERSIRRGRNEEKRTRGLRGLDERDESLIPRIPLTSIRFFPPDHQPLRPRKAIPTRSR